MKKKIYNILLIITSLIGYLEWGQTNSQFLFQMETDIIFKLFTDTTSIIHPLIIIPLAGQILLLISLFQAEPGKWLSFIGIGSIGILFLLVLLAGVLSMNFKIILSSLPFLIISFFCIKLHIKKI